MPPSNRKIRARLSSEGGNTPRPSRSYRPTPSMLPAFLNSSLLSSLSTSLLPLAFFYFSKRYARPNRTSKPRSFYGRICNFKLAVLCHHQRSKRFPHREISWVFFFFITGWFTGSWRRGGHRVTFERDFSWIYGPPVLTTSGFINTNISSSRWFFLLFHTFFFLANRIYLRRNRLTSFFIFLTIQLVPRG